MKKAVKQEEPGSHWESHIFKFTCFYNVNQFVTHQLLDWAKLAQKEAGWRSQQFLAYIRMVNKWLCLPKLMGMYLWFLTPSHRQGKVHRYKDFVGKRLKVLHPFVFAAPGKGHSHSHCNDGAYLKNLEEGSVAQSVPVMSAP